MPALGVYFVKPASNASIAAFFICSGVSKSGSPAPKPQTSMPSAFMALALLSIESVSEGLRIVARDASSISVWVFKFFLKKRCSAVLQIRSAVREMRFDERLQIVIVHLHDL